jgi:hypothetical protein
VIRKVRPPLVIVEWLDAASTTDEASAESLSTIDKNMTHSVGFLLKRDARGAYLVTDWLECGEMRCLHFVPNGMIRAVRTVRTAAPKSRKPE